MDGQVSFKHGDCLCDGDWVTSIHRKAACEVWVQTLQQANYGFIRETCRYPHLSMKLVSMYYQLPPTMSGSLCPFCGYRWASTACYAIAGPQPIWTTTRKIMSKRKGKDKLRAGSGGGMGYRSPEKPNEKKSTGLQPKVILLVGPQEARVLRSREDLPRARSHICSPQCCIGCLFDSKQSVRQR